ncbi:hypothetical protein AMECASPLE_028197 [Ameca splendens]|uniref:Uncharacterized protein n=1 Tax=Ameca splendens TaxID=208324 RepID=A0ABV1A3F4_9TELE
MQFNGLDPLQPVLRVLCSEVPDAVIHADVKTALVKLVRLSKERRGLMNNNEVCIESGRTITKAKHQNSKLKVKFSFTSIKLVRNGSKVLLQQLFVRNTN